ncbi:MAG: DUF1638 domain-containing protein [Methanosarcina sp.]|nr:DUF1638 domain-containing protein [Methanosarcina sp.]MDD4621404.1 DUF1638 domain-containing protein [Methanosarcina sp.]
MKVISIVSCKIFEDEIVHLLEHDKKMGEVLILKNESSEEIVRKLGKAGVPCQEIVLRDIETCRNFRNLQQNRDAGLILVLNILEVVDKVKNSTRLKMNVYEAILKMALFSDGLLLFYGLCGNAFKDIEKDFEYLERPFVLLRDAEGNIVDNCLCATLGSKKAFMEAKKDLSGENREGKTFMLTPMWAANWEKMVVANGFARSLEALEESKRVFKTARYTKVAKINTGIKYKHNFEPKVREFAAFYEFGITEIKAEQVIFERCYSELKHSL